VSFKTTHDILKQVQDIHAQLAAYHEQMGEGADEEQIRVLLDYLQRHERKTEEALANTEEIARNALLNRWFQYTPDIADTSILRTVALSSDMSASEVIAKVLEYDEALHRLLVELAEGVTRDDLRELLTALAQVQEGEKKTAARLAHEIERG
jgi:hypothetical protein